MEFHEAALTEWIASKRFKVVGCLVVVWLRESMRLRDAWQMQVVQIVTSTIAPINPFQQG